MTRITGASVLAEVAKRHGMTSSDLMSLTRKREVSWPRQEAMYEIFVRCPHLSYPAIGRMLGGMDHTTVLHGVRVHCERIGKSYDEIRFFRNSPLKPDVFNAYAEAMRQAA